MTLTKASALPLSSWSCNEHFQCRLRVVLPVLHVQRRGPLQTHVQQRRRALATDVQYGVGQCPTMSQMSGAEPAPQ